MYIYNILRPIHTIEMGLSLIYHTLYLTGRLDTVCPVDQYIYLTTQQRFVCLVNACLSALYIDYCEDILFNREQCYFSQPCNTI